ncbi:PilW family protein [Oxalobacteraceae bacterium R-40]|uniref:PilW family protein n=1 Tax=Keguizhuia sedimenti TaxID=3064264 RepID=A0ABU1BRN3_9BURK|nr:PilW family protein [Oxalobacteraceae bacterium R-40]
MNSVSKLRNSGFGLVEIMVGIAIGLIGTLVMLQVGAVFEGQKRTTTSGADAQTNGAIALYMLERDLRRAGYGLNVASALGCVIKRKHEDEASTPDLILTPVTIANGSGDQPDAIRFLASSKEGFSVPAKITKDHPPEATNVFLNTVLGVENQDMIVLHEPGLNCTLFQATGIPNGTVQVHHQNSDSKWNPPSGGDIYPVGGFNIGASAINLGAIVDRTYSLDANSNLVLADYSSSENSIGTPQPLAADIVQLQAQYGFDTRTGVQADTRVDRWSEVMIDADGSGGTPGDNGDLQRIYAVRLAIVARSPVKEKPQDDGTCNITTTPPQWLNANPNEDPADPNDDDLALVVNIHPDGTANPDWKCYRYRVFDTVIPLRNLLWRE